MIVPNKKSIERTLPRKPTTVNAAILGTILEL